MCGRNNDHVNDAELLAGCHRYGVENPVQTRSKRLSLFGNDNIGVEVLESMKRDLGQDFSDVFGRLSAVTELDIKKTYAQY